LAIEPVEKRHALTAGFVGATWTILGTGSDDAIIVERDPGRAGTLQATVNGVVIGTRPEWSVRTLRIHGLAGDDTITVDVPGNTGLKTLVRGGTGNDLITTGDGDDLLFGGGGSDTLVAGRGHDLIRGDRGDDALIGSLGDDTLFGGRGHDTLRGGAGRDRLSGGADRDVLFGRVGIDAAFLDPGERLIGNVSTNPLAEVSDLDRMREWYVQTAQCSDHAHRPRRAELFSEFGAPAAVLRPATLCARATLCDT
jgi:Ca2+-binding RTX toxin-like protein